jgi:hypothetical protein
MLMRRTLSFVLRGLSESSFNIYVTPCLENSEFGQDGTSAFSVDEDGGGTESFWDGGCCSFSVLSRDSPPRQLPMTDRLVVSGKLQCEK